MRAPVDAERALEALRDVQALSPRALDAAMTAKIGKPMLGVLRALAKAQAGDDAPAEAIAERVHLMVLAYLLCDDVSRPG